MNPVDLDSLSPTTTDPPLADGNVTTVNITALLEGSTTTPADTSASEMELLTPLHALALAQQEKAKIRYDNCSFILISKCVIGNNCVRKSRNAFFQ